MWSQFVACFRLKPFHSLTVVFSSCAWFASYSQIGNQSIDHEQIATIRYVFLEFRPRGEVAAHGLFYNCLFVSVACVTSAWNPATQGTPLLYCRIVVVTYQHSTVIRDLSATRFAVGPRASDTFFFVSVARDAELHGTGV